MLIAFQIGYMEWPPHNSMFVFQAQYEIFSKTDRLLTNLFHPIILLGLLAQIILLIGAFLPNLNKKINTIPFRELKRLFSTSKNVQMVLQPVFHIHSKDNVHSFSMKLRVNKIYY
jgi:hypothetical protein